MNEKKWLCRGVLLFSLVLICAPVMATTTWQQTGCPTGWNISALSIDPTDPRTLFAGTNGGVFKSTDGGGSWSVVLQNEYVSCLEIDPASSGTVYAGTSGGGVFKSTDGGGSWSAINSGLPAAAGQGISVLSLAIDPTSPWNIYVGTDAGGVYKTTDGGNSWSEFSSGMTYDNQGTSPKVGSLEIDPTNPQTLYAGTWYAGVLKSLNGGYTWSGVRKDLTGTIVFSLAIDPASTGTVYAGTIDSGVYKSINGGGTWSAVNNGLPASTYVLSLAIDPISSQTVYAGTAGGVFKSANGGGTWSAINSGLPGGSDVLSLEIDPISPNTLYAGTGGSGVFKGLSDPPLPTIYGSPPSVAIVGTEYGFTPSSTNAASFSISGSVPQGLDFNTTTGALSGAPTTVGTYSGIVISATNSTGTAALTPFSITVITVPDDNPYARISGTPQLYGSLQSAYNAAITGAHIQAQGMTFVENLTMDAPRDLTLDGGFDADFSTRNGYTTLQGTLMVGRGSLVVDRLIIE